MDEKYILLDDVENLGKAGETVSVSAGYARNYLLPRKLALKASKGALRQSEARKEKVEAKRKEEVKAMQELATKIESLEINISANVGEDEKLYGSVTSHNIADELEKLGVKIEHHRVILKKPIKELGAYEVEIKLRADVVAKAKVNVIKA